VDISTPRFNIWRDLLLLQLDVELGCARVNLALRLQGRRLNEEALQQLGTTAGAWADYAFNASYLQIDGVLERTRQLVTKAHRQLVKPILGTGAPDAAPLLAKLKDISDRNGLIRDPIAHGGGPISQIGEERLLEGLAVLQTWPGVERLFPSFEERQQAWTERAQQWGAIVASVIDDVAGELDAMVPWEDAARRTLPRPRQGGAPGTE
jgi:hypothetical protein